MCDHIPKSLLGAPQIRGCGKSHLQFLQSVSSLGNVGLENADKNRQVQIMWQTNNLSLQVEEGLVKEKKIQMLKLRM